jgi:hypothetical protein
MNLKDIQKLQKIAQGGKRVATTAKDLEVMAQLEALGEAPLKYTAADRARAGNKAAEFIKSRPKVKASEALGQAMEKGYKKVSTTQSDRTEVGNDNIGGANFSALSQVDPAYKGKVWGVMDEGTAKRLTNLSSPETVWTTMLGSANQLKSNPVVFDKMKKQFLAAMKEGKLSPELEAKFNHNLELTFGEGAQIRDPNIWKEADTFEKRAALADLMMGQGIPPKKGGVAMGGEKSGKGVIFKPTQTLISNTEPSLMHPDFGGDVPTFALGPRLFNLSGTAEMRPDLQTGFPMLLHGEDLGYNFDPVPTEVFLPTWHKHFRDVKPERFQGPWTEEIINRRKNKSYKLKGAEGPGYYDLALGLEGEGLPSQDLHDEFIRHLIREGYAEGGAVKMANGSGVTAPRKYVPPSQLFPLKTEPENKSALQNIANAAKEESKTFDDTGATMDIINRGPVSDALGSFVDLANMPLQGLDYLASKIPAFSKPASVMEPEGERVSIAPVSTDEPYGGKAAWNKQFQKSGITSKTERPVTEMAVSLASPFAPVVAGKALKAGKALAPAAGKLAQEFAESTQFGLPFELNVMKNKGGNWTTDLPTTVRDLKSSVLNETGYKNLAERAGQDVADRLRIENEPKSAINKWVDTKLVNYIKNDMGTSQDPIRIGIERRASEVEKLRETHQKRIAKMEADIEKNKAGGKNTTLSERDLAATKEKLDEEYQMASRGLSHMTPPENGWDDFGRWIPETDTSVKNKRQTAGFPREGIASHPASQEWENTADSSIGFNRVSAYTNPDPSTGLYSMNQQSTLAQNPWLSKVAEKNPDEFAYRIGTPLFLHDTEFNHMIDELGEALDPASKLPKNLKISPKDLEKMTVDDVSALSGKISAWREVQKVKADKELANNPAVHTFKEYTDNNPKGVSWQQIKRPEGYSPEEQEKYVRAATKYEGDVMRHCVGGVGHCDPLLNDEVEIYSLRDAKGEPHVTIEVEKGTSAPAFYEKNRELLDSPELYDDHFEINNSADTSAQYIKRVIKLLNENGYVQGKDYFTPELAAPIIREIKGKGNKKPNDEYIPFIQDFIRSGKWSEINDIPNTGMKHSLDALGVDTFRKLKEKGIDVPPLITSEDAIKLEQQLDPNYFNDPRFTREDYIDNFNQTYAKGGAVQSPNGFDYESHVNKLMDAHNLSNFDYEGHVNKIMGMAEGGAAYNTSPDMSDGGAFIQAPSFKIGGRIPLLTR